MIFHQKYLGCKIHTNNFLSPKTLKVSIRDYIDVSPEFRAKFNEWSSKTFGWDGGEIIRYGDDIYMHPDTLMDLQKQIEKQNQDSAMRIAKHSFYGAFHGQSKSSSEENRTGFGPGNHLRFDI